jgi:integrase
MNWGQLLYQLTKVTAGAIFAHAIRLRHHPRTKQPRRRHEREQLRPYQPKMACRSLEEIKQFLALFPSGQIAVAIGLNAFLALRKPELQALTPEDFDGDFVRIHRDTKTGNDERLPVIAPGKRLLADGSEPISLRAAAKQIRKRIQGTNLRWLGWYVFRSGMATNLFELGVPPEAAALVLRNNREVVRKHYIRLEKAGKKVEAVARFEQAYDACAVSVQ